MACKDGHDHNYTPYACRVRMHLVLGYNNIVTVVETADTLRHSCISLSLLQDILDFT